MVEFLSVGVMFIGNTSLCIMFTVQGMWSMAFLSLAATLVTAWGLVKTLRQPAELQEDEEEAAAA